MSKSRLFRGNLGIIALGFLLTCICPIAACAAAAVPEIPKGIIFGDLPSGPPGVDLPNPERIAASSFGFIRDYNGIEIQVEPGQVGRLALVFKIRNRTLKPVSIMEVKLPWRSLNSTHYYLAIPGRYGLPPIERSKLIFDPLMIIGMKERTIKPGDQIAGEMYLDNLFGDTVATQLRNTDVSLFFSLRNHCCPESGLIGLPNI